MPRRDRFGRKRHCCDGNHEAVYGSPVKGAATVEQWADAMGIDRDHMSERGLALAIPPAFAEYMTGQMVMHILHESKWQVPIISYEEAQADPAKAALLRRWVEGIAPLLAGDKMSVEPATSRCEPCGDVPSGDGGDAADRAEAAGGEQPSPPRKGGQWRPGERAA